MRTGNRKARAISSVAVISVSAWAAAANGQQVMYGGDPDGVVSDAIASLNIFSIQVIGDVTAVGQAHMQGTLGTSPTQQIAPMLRQLNGTACSTLGGAIGQELIGVGALAILGANQTSGDGDGQSADTSDDCNDNITGGVVLHVPGCTANDGCDASENYTFADWRDVLAMVYGGQNHNKECSGDTNMPSTNGNICFSNSECGAGSCSAIFGTHPGFARDPRKINCNSSVRRALVDNWGSLFTAGTGAQSCRTGSCTKLRHAFRRPDDSTTDAFVSLVGLSQVPVSTTAFDPSLRLPSPDVNAAAHPFCNAGEAKMNRGDADYLDLDPIRRAVDQAPGTRIALEQVAEASLPQFGGNNNDANCADGDSTVPGIQPQVPPTNSSSSSVPNLLPSQVIANSQALLQDELGFPGGGSAVTKPNTRVCLGLVLPITIPANYTTADAYFGASADGTTPPVPCSVDPVTGSVAMANKILDTTFTGSLCPDGKPQPCRVPVNNSTGTNNFNCYVAGLNPTILPVRDNRGFNLHPVTSAGIYQRDDYVNPNISVAIIGAGRQHRVVTAFFRLHFDQVTNLNGGTPTLPAGQFCRKLSAGKQIGCLVKANACSIGYSGRDAIDALAPGSGNMAFRLGDVAPSLTAILNPFTIPPTPGGYPLIQPQWINSVIGFDNVVDGLYGGPERTLLDFLRTPALVDPIVAGKGLVVIPPGIPRSSGCPR